MTGIDLQNAKELVKQSAPNDLTIKTLKAQTTDGKPGVPRSSPPSDKPGGVVRVSNDRNVQGQWSGHGTGSWTEWDVWSACSETCSHKTGGREGTQTRMRECQAKKRIECTGYARETRPCNSTNACEPLVKKDKRE